MFQAAKRSQELGDMSLEHVPFGLVHGEDGKKFATRSGETVRLKDLLDEEESRCLTELQERDSDADDLHWAQNYYGTLEKRGQSPVSRPLAALNTAIASDGVLIQVKGNISKPVLILGVHNTPSEAVLHHVIKVDKGCSLTLLESGPFATKLNTVMEGFLEQGAGFEHIRTQGRDLIVGRQLIFSRRVFYQFLGSAGRSLPG